MSNLIPNATAIEEASEHIKSALKILGFFEGSDSFDASEHLKDTPKRIAKAWTEYTFKDINKPTFKCTSFSGDKINSVQIVRDINFSSLCAHHFFPFMGHCHVAYLPNEKIIGLSKIPRLVNYIAAQPQIQEILVNQIADSLYKIIEPRFVMVIMPDVVHTCCSCRGVKSSSKFISSSIRSNMSNEDIRSLKEEVIKLLQL